MGYLQEYIDKGFAPKDLLEELQRLVEQYNSITGRYLFLYVAAMFKHVQGISMEEEDFYIIPESVNPASKYMGRLVLPHK